MSASAAVARWPDRPRQRERLGGVDGRGGRVPTAGLEVCDRRQDLRPHRQVSRSRRRAGRPPRGRPAIWSWAPPRYRSSARPTAARAIHACSWTRGSACRSAGPRQRSPSVTRPCRYQNQCRPPATRSTVAVSPAVAARRSAARTLSLSRCRRRIQPALPGPRSCSPAASASCSTHAVCRSPARAGGRRGCGAPRTGGWSPAAGTAGRRPRRRPSPGTSPPGRSGPWGVVASGDGAGRRRARNPPSNTARAASRSCSATVSSSYHASISPSIVVCRLAVRAPARTANRSSRCARICRGDSIRLCAAANSIARGMPSRAAQSRAISRRSSAPAPIRSAPPRPAR